MKKLPVTLYKRSDGSFYPTTQIDADMLKGFKVGDGIAFDWTKVRNYEFLQKYMVLMHFAFDQFEPEDAAPEKNFDRFREEITILSGYYTMSPSVKGHSRAVADSISFAKMEQEDFDQLYDKTITVLIKWVLKTYTKEDVNEVLSHISEFG